MINNKIGAIVKAGLAKDDSLNLSGLPEPTQKAVVQELCKLLEIPPIVQADRTQRGDLVPYTMALLRKAGGLLAADAFGGSTDAARILNSLVTQASGVISPAKDFEAAASYRYATGDKTDKRGTYQVPPVADAPLGIASYFDSRRGESASLWNSSPFLRIALGETYPESLKPQLEFIERLVPLGINGSASRTFFTPAFPKIRGFLAGLNEQLDNTGIEGLGKYTITIGEAAKSQKQVNPKEKDSKI